MNTTGMRGESREAFVGRVRDALGAPGRVVSHGGPVSGGVTSERLVSAGADVVGLFVAAARKSGMVVHEAEAGTLVETLTRLLSGAAYSRVGVAVVDVGLRGVVSEAVEAAGKAFVSWGAGESAEVWFDAGVSITDVEAAVAETGSIVMGWGPALPRGAFMVPPVHIAVVRAGLIVPDLIDLFSRERVGGKGEGGGWTIVSGPSKTADIEGILVTGVHGPGELHVVVVSEAVGG